MRIQEYTSRKRGKTRLNEINHVQLLEKKKNKYLNCFLSHLSRFKFYKGKSFDVSGVFESWDAKRSLAEKKLTLYPPLVTETEFLLRILIQYQADN